MPFKAFNQIQKALNHLKSFTIFSKRLLSVAQTFEKPVYVCLPVCLDPTCLGPAVCPDRSGAMQHDVYCVLHIACLYSTNGTV